MTPPVPDFVRHGTPAKGAQLKNTVFGFTGCKIILNGFGPEILGQDPKQLLFWACEDVQNWFYVDGKTRTVTCAGSATYNEVTHEIHFSNLYGTIEWTCR